VRTVRGFLPLLGLSRGRVISLKGKAELERVREIMERVEAQCFIANSIKSKVSLAAEFFVAPSPH
jgi:organic hydroperoxide reductase OsmC/OhrA